MKSLVQAFILTLVCLNIVRAVSNGTPTKSPFLWDLNESPPPVEVSDNVNGQVIINQHPQEHLCAIHRPTCIHWKTLSNAEKRAIQRRLFRQNNPEKIVEQNAKRKEAYRALPKEERKKIYRRQKQSQERKYEKMSEADKIEMKRIRSKKARIYEAKRKVTMPAEELQLYRARRRESASKVRKNEKLRHQ